MATTAPDIDAGHPAADVPDDAGVPPASRYAPRSCSSRASSAARPTSASARRPWRPGSPRRCATTTTRSARIAATTTRSPGACRWRRHAAVPDDLGGLQWQPEPARFGSTNCAPGRLPGQLPGPITTDVRALLSLGRSTGAGISCTGPGGEQRVGSNHGSNVAIGYATIDVAATCSVALPVDPGYFTGEILFDNVLIGDYQDVNGNTVAGNYAGGNPMVHIRAVPEGGPAGGQRLRRTCRSPSTIVTRAARQRPPSARSIAVSRCRRRLRPAGSAVPPQRSRRSTRSGAKASPPTPLVWWQIAPTT